MDGRHLPNDVGVDAVVLVTKFMANGDDVRPGYLGILLPQFGRQVVHRLCDDEHGILNGRTKGQVALEVLQRSAF